ncbi:hypothetical protein [Parvibaculum sp.]|uniref:hypothetical protein n=1 Tax=Parvibaculum sp. TaxID=2024848 RepID=UPI003919FBD2
MTQPERYIGRETASAMLAERGFNTHDIECVLDLAGPVARNGAEVWPADLVERVAARAWWLGQREAGMVLPAAA